MIYPLHSQSLPHLSCFCTSKGSKEFFGFQIGLFTREESSANRTVHDSAVRDLYLGIYGGLGFGQAVSVVIGSVFLYMATLEGSRKLHDNTLSNVIRLPMSYFDTTPQGRILNR